jgi:hypothetical protein
MLFPHDDLPNLGGLLGFSRGGRFRGANAATPGDGSDGCCSYQHRGRRPTVQLGASAPRAFDGVMMSCAEWAQFSVPNRFAYSVAAPENRSRQW